jgi:hypothetical protein
LTDPARAGWPRGAAVAVGVFLLAALVSTWPQVRHLNDGLTDVWDAKFTAWVMHWDFAQTFRNPFRLFHANIFHPAPYALAFSENLYGAALFGFPLYAAGLSTLASYNVLFLLGMLLSGVGAWALARWITGDAAASLLAGFVYAFNPWRLAQIPHIQFQWGAFLPLFLLFLLKYVDEQRRRDAALFALFFAWNALCNLHYALFGGMTAVLVLVWAGLAKPDGWRRARSALLWLTLACAAVLPFLWPYFRVAQLYGGRRSAGEMQTFSGRFVDFLTAGAQNKLYAPLTQHLGKAEGDFFPGIVPVLLLVYAVVVLRRVRPPARAEIPQPTPGRRKVIRALDVATTILAALWLAATLVPGLRLGPLKLGDPGRIVVFAAIVLIARLALAFPGRSRFRDLRDFVQRQRLGEQPLLFLLIGLLGVLIALGANTPFYRFLFQSFGAVLRGIRAPARGIVLFHLALGVLAALGLSLLLRRARRPLTRVTLVVGALMLTAFEYRAFPVPVHSVEETPGPVYRWLGRVRPPGAIIELPFGADYDVEYEFRSTAHWHPLLNGYSGFGPPHYHALLGLLSQSPIPDSALDEIRRIGARLLVLHPHPAPFAPARPANVQAILRWTAAGHIVPIGSFPHGDARDLVFRFSDAPAFDTGLPPGAAEEAARELDRFRFAVTRVSPPFGFIDWPREGATVTAGSYGFGWALDDSGVKEVRVSATRAAPIAAALGGDHRGVAAIYPEYPDSARPGYGFSVPNLPPGPHTLIVTIVAKDGGEAKIERRIRIR